MAVPDFQSFFRPLLEYAGDGLEKNIREAVDRLGDQFGLSEDDRAELLSSGKQTVLANRVHWALTYLDKAQALKRTRRSHFVMTDRGRGLLAQNPGRITKRELLQFPEFRAFATARSTNGADGGTTTEQSDIANPAAESTPEDAIYKAEATIVSKLQEQLIEQITEQTPAFFERLVVDLIVAMGYGGNRGHVVERLRRSGDEGIDGIVNEDPLGLDVVYVQAKRYGPENTIGRERIQQFAGALVGQGASKGVFVTTSSFSRGAIDYAQRVPHRIILVDGKELSRLMVQYGVGVRTETTITIKRLDLDYFEDADVGL